MTLERTYIIPLRKGWLKAPRYKRAKKAVNTLREFLSRHMKSEDVRLLPELNLEIWKHGIRNPPSQVKVNVVKDDKGVVKVQLFGKPMAEEKKEEEKKGIMGKIAEKVTGKETPAAKVAETKPVEAPAEKPARAAASADQPTKSALLAAKPAAKPKSPEQK